MRRKKQTLWPDGVVEDAPAVKNELPMDQVWPIAEKNLMEAENRGTHSRKFLTVCDGCGEWVDAIYTIVPLTHKRLCRKCGGADKDKK